MINAKELRLGNFIYQGNDVITVTDLQFDGRMYFINCYRDEGFKPISITEEWLTRGGWKWNEECKSYEHKDHIRMSLKYVDVSNSYTMYNHVLQALIAKRIWYVHQLQNLYFTLTGEELVLESKP